MTGSKVSINVPATTVVAAGVYSAQTSGTYLDKLSIPPSTTVSANATIDVTPHDHHHVDDRSGRQGGDGSPQPSLPVYGGTGSAGGCGATCCTPHTRVVVPEARHTGGEVADGPALSDPPAPRTKERLMSGNTITVTAAGVVYARLCVDYAEQSVQVGGQSGKLGVGIAGTGSGVVAGVGVVRARYTLTATNTITTDTSSDGRARYTLDATQATTVTPLQRRRQLSTP